MNKKLLVIIIAGLLGVAAVIDLVISSTQANAQYFLTVEELNQRRDSMAGKDIRMSGAVLGDSIVYDADSLTLTFTVVNIPGDNKEIEAQGGLAMVLHNAVMDTSLPRLDVVYHGVQPDLLKNEAQAIMTGRLGAERGVAFVFGGDHALSKRHPSVGGADTPPHQQYEDHELAHRHQAKPARLRRGRARSSPAL